MDLQLAGKIVAITGASKGIGLACAERFAEEGCSLHLVSRTAADLEAARKMITASHDVSVDIHPIDLAARGSAEKMIDAIGQVNVLVNNAGAIPSGFLNDIDEARWRESWELKVFGYINLTREFYGSMKEAGGGVIVNVIGAGGEKPTPGYIAGGAGNAALMALSRALGSSSNRDNIRVVGLNPGLIQTERLISLMQSAAERRFGDPGRWEELLDKRYPPGQPEHIADMTAFLASPRSSFTTGTIVTVDGGSSAR
jgi:NAD(P)-dependent dehydrogenase (short-subunit alcohol dehydrogenase family)